MINKGKNTKLNEIRKGFWDKLFQPLKINTMRLSFLFLLLLSITCKGQPVEREKFDFELYKKYKENGYHYIRENGNIIIAMEKDETFKKKGVIEETYFQEELVHKYPYYSIYKEFYEDGYIKKEMMSVGIYTHIGKTLLYDRKGSLTIIDEDKKFGKIKIDYVMNFLQKKGIIDLKTGAGWYDSEFHLNYSLKYEKVKGKKYWIVVKKKGERFDPEKHTLPKVPEDVIITPAEYIPYVWYIDAKTGQVYVEEELYKNRKKLKNSIRQNLLPRKEDKDL
nr:hypothetical protein [uncultured Capnocytophaga sp.]